VVVHVYNPSYQKVKIKKIMVCQPGKKVSTTPSQSLNQQVDMAVECL
jgi:hypothetical protein